MRELVLTWLLRLPVIAVLGLGLSYALAWRFP
jgi:hypothetical protein